MSRVLLVSGGGRGIGAAICRLAGRRGYKVAVNYPDLPDDAERVVADIERHGGTARAVRADVRVPEQIRAMFNEIDATLGPVSALVNNVGGGTIPVEIPDMSGEYILSILTVNFLSAACCAAEASRRMSTKRGGRGGAIVNISSTAAVYLDRPGRTIYAAAKGAIESYTRGAARELADAGIRVNAVRLGIIDTPVHDVRAQDMQERIARTVPLKRAGLAEEVAEAALFLLSDQASYITGDVLAVSGGR